MHRLVRALPLLLVLAVLLPGALADVSGPLVLDVAGPTAVAPAQRAFYNVTISGGPTGAVNYSVTYYVTGANTSGAAPLSATPVTVTGNRTIYQLNVTSSTAEGSLTLIVNVMASPQGGGASENGTTSHAITVTRPLTLTATFHNGGSTAAANVTVRWYIDGAPVGTSLIRTIAANGDATVNFAYLPAGLSAGEHTVTAMADLDRDGVINSARGEIVTTTLFYNQAQPPSTGWVVLLGIGVFIPVFIGVVALRRRGQR